MTLVLLCGTLSFESILSTKVGHGHDLVVAALERARMLFPFPVVGIDTDNGAEFMNAGVVAYCEREHLTFTRGRPEVKNDQCYVEEKNRSVVRRVVGHDRLEGLHASQQLGELCSQPLHCALRWNNACLNRNSSPSQNLILQPWSAEPQTGKRRF